MKKALFVYVKDELGNILESQTVFVGKTQGEKTAKDKAAKMFKRRNAQLSCVSYWVVISQREAFQKGLLKISPIPVKGE